jgi:hypothetical protein
MIWCRGIAERVHENADYEFQKEGATVGKTAALLLVFTTA